MRQLLQYAAVLVAWALAAALWLFAGIPHLALALAGLHLVELAVVGLRTGRAYGVTAVRSVVLCLLFGFTWWLPLRRQMKAETFTDADFAREDTR